MKGKEKNNLATRASRRTRRAFVLCVAALLTLVAAHTLAAVRVSAQERPNIAGEIKDGGKPKPKPAAKQPGAKPDVDTPLPRNNRQPVRRAPRSVGGPLNVTILTGLPETNVYLNRDTGAMQKLGTTGPDGKLSTRLPRGLHSVTASRQGSPVVRQQVDVRPGNTTFSFDFGGRSAARGTAVASASTAGDVFNRFLDPKQTDAVTLADWQLAQAQTATAYSRDPGDPLNTAQALFAEGQVAYLRGDYASALVSFNNSALATPGSALAYYGLGNAYLATGQLGEASRAFQQAVRNNARMALAYKGMGDVLSKQGKEKEALDYYERARSLGYASPSLETSMARTLLKQRRWQQALNILLDVAKVKPSAEVFIGIGDSYVGVKQPMSAAAAYRQAAQHDSKSALAHYKYGELSFQMREYAPAMESLERALALDPAGTTFNRARAREMADRASEKLGRRK